MKKIILTAVILSLVLFLAPVFADNGLVTNTNFSPAAQSDLGTAVKPGAFYLTNGIMEGTLEISKGRDSYIVYINLYQPDSSHLADFDGPALVIGNRIIVLSSMGDDARITVTMSEGIAVVEANEEAEMNYCGMNATFNGTYDCKPLM